MQFVNLDKVASQLDVEKLYSKSNIKKAIRKDIEETEELMEKVAQGVELLEEYVSQEYYDSKNRRIAYFSTLDFEEVVMDVFIVTIQLNQPMLFTNIVGQLAESLGFTVKGDGVKTIAEVLAILCETDVYDIFKDDKYDSLKIKSNYGLPNQLVRFIHQTKYLPPMICNPKTVYKNSDSAYLSTKSSLILGRGTYHNEEICLDSINRFNQIPLTLNVDLLKTYSEEPTSPAILEDADKYRQWEEMVRDSYVVYKDLVKQGNEFYLTHKVDKRGRTYAIGYHVSTQANSFRKAIVDLADKEVIDGF